LEARQAGPEEIMLQRIAVLPSFMLLCIGLSSCGKLAEQRAPMLPSGEITIADVPSRGKPEVLFHLSASNDADRRFLGEIWERCAAVFGRSDWVNFGPDAQFHEIVIQHDGERLCLQSWHQIYERSGKVVATSRGLEPLNGRTVAEALKNDDPAYVRKRDTFDAIMTQCLSRRGK
jgi:hypothetical protein